MRKEDKIKILITGARGFVGKNLVEYLNSQDSAGYKLFYPYHDELELLDSGKVRDFINSYDINVIIHCANIGGTRKTGYDINSTDVVYKNLRMFFNLSSSLGSHRRMILLGSGAEYSAKYYLPRMSEDYFGQHIPEDAYGFSKFVCSKYIENSINIINLRLFGVFGKYEDYRYRFISNSIVKNLVALPIAINQNVYYDYLYINDLVKIIEYFINNKPNHKFYNVTTGKVIDLLSIAKKINEILPSKSDIVIKNEGLNTEYSADNTRLLKELPGYNFTPIEEAIKQLYLYYKNNLDKIDAQALQKDEYIKYCCPKKQMVR